MDSILKSLIEKYIERSEALVNPFTGGINGRFFIRNQNHILHQPIRNQQGQ